MENPIIIEISQMPSNIEEFVTLRDQFAKTPEGGAAIFILALKLWLENNELGLQCLVTTVNKDRLTIGSTYKGFDLLKSDLNLIDMQLKKTPAIPNSYVDGSSPINNYLVGFPYKFVFTSNAYSGDKNGNSFKVFVKCSGADSARPIAMQKNDKGIWKASEWSSILVGIKKSPPTDDV